MYTGSVGHDLGPVGSISETKQNTNSHKMSIEIVDTNQSGANQIDLLMKKVNQNSSSDLSESK